MDHTEEAHILSILQTTMNRELLQTEIDAAAAANKEKDEFVFLDGEDEEDEYEKPQPYMKDAMTMEMIGWMQEGVKILSFIEGYELDCKIADFFKEEEVPKYYDEKILLSNEYNTTARGFAKMKQDKTLLVNAFPRQMGIFLNWKLIWCFYLQKKRELLFFVKIKKKLF